MRKTIATLVRTGDNYTYVSRSFEKIDDEAVATIRGCIEEDNELSLSKDEIERCFTPSFSSLKENYDWLGDPEADFDRQGDCLWEYNDGIEIFCYILHVSIVETN